MDVFAEAVDAKLQEFYSGEEKEEVDMSSATQAVDTLYQKIVAINSSPVMATLNMLVAKLSGKNTTAMPQYGSTPQMPGAGNTEADQLARLHMQGSSMAPAPRNNEIRDAIQIESSVPGW